MKREAKRDMTLILYGAGVGMLAASIIILVGRHLDRLLS